MSLMLTLNKRKGHILIQTPDGSEAKLYLDRVDSANRVRLRFEAARHVTILRSEVVEKYAAKAAK